MKAAMKRIVNIDIRNIKDSNLNEFKQMRNDLNELINISYLYF